VNGSENSEEDEMAAHGYRLDTPDVEDDPRADQDCSRVNHEVSDDDEDDTDTFSRHTAATPTYSHRSNNGCNRNVLNEDSSDSDADSEAELQAADELQGAHLATPPRSSPTSASVSTRFSLNQAQSRAQKPTTKRPATDHASPKRGSYPSKKFKLDRRRQRKEGRKRLVDETIPRLLAGRVFLEAAIMKAEDDAMF